MKNCIYNIEKKEWINNKPGENFSLILCSINLEKLANIFSYLYVNNNVFTFADIKIIDTEYTVKLIIESKDNTFISYSELYKNDEKISISEKIIGEKTISFMLRNYSVPKFKFMPKKLKDIVMICFEPSFYNLDFIVNNNLTLNSIRSYLWFDYNIAINKKDRDFQKSRCKHIIEYFMLSNKHKKNYHSRYKVDKDSYNDILKIKEFNIFLDYIIAIDVLKNPLYININKINISDELIYDEHSIIEVLPNLLKDFNFNSLITFNKEYPVKSLDKNLFEIFNLEKEILSIEFDNKKDLIIVLEEYINKLYNYRDSIPDYLFFNRDTIESTKDEYLKITNNTYNLLFSNEEFLNHIINEVVKFF